MSLRSVRNGEVEAILALERHQKLELSEAWVSHRTCSPADYLRTAAIARLTWFLRGATAGWAAALRA
jgi:hypothetical protein